MTVLEQKFKGKEFLIKNKKTGKLEVFGIAEIFLNNPSDSYGILLENPNFILPVTCYSNGSASINGSLGKYYEVPKKTQEELAEIQLDEKY